MWIEIHCARKLNQKSWSLPTRECGLKFLFSRLELYRSPVTPYAGVWIEINVPLITLLHTAVTPYAGVWIEIARKNRKNSWKIVTPYAGVWIEILISINLLICIRVTPYAGVWIEMR